jgi:hypothetical protein
MIIQKAQFSTGGFAIHKIPAPAGKGRISAWFDIAGGLIDAEYIDARGRARPIKYAGKLWNELCGLGRVYK